jgi:PKD repeat protein
VTTYTAQGVIERPGDIDMFSFAASAGAVTAAFSPAARAANLDASIELRNSAGTVLASANPLDALNGSVSFTVPSAGTYYIAITGVGKGDVSTTGYSNYGSLGNYALQVSALAGVSQPPPGQPPTAALTATPTSGTVPLTTSLSATGSTDTDGSIVSYEWTFGDGSTGNGPTVTHTYSNVGSYTATVKVTDSSGLTATRSVVISASAVPTTPTMNVANIAMSLTAGSNRRYRANAAVKIVNGTGQPVSGVTVKGSWKGLTSASVSGTTNSSGIVTFASVLTRNSGTFIFTVTGATRTGYKYLSAANVETSDSITR